MKAMGLTQLRVLAATEGPDSEPWRIVPSLQPVRRRHCTCLGGRMKEQRSSAPRSSALVAPPSLRQPSAAAARAVDEPPRRPNSSPPPQCPGTYNTDVLDGFDFLISEMGKRKMRATVTLNNEWHWSGGFVQYVLWARAIASGKLNATAPCSPMGTDASGARLHLLLSCSIFSCRILFGFCAAGEQASAQASPPLPRTSSPASKIPAAPRRCALPRREASQAGRDLVRLAQGWIPGAQLSRTRQGRLGGVDRAPPPAASSSSPLAAFAPVSVHVAGRAAAPAAAAACCDPAFVTIAE